MGSGGETRTSYVQGQGGDGGDSVSDKGPTHKGGGGVVEGHPTSTGVV